MEPTETGREAITHKLMESLKRFVHFWMSVRAAVSCLCGVVRIHFESICFELRSSCGKGSFELNREQALTVFLTTLVQNEGCDLCLGSQQ